MSRARHKPDPSGFLETARRSDAIPNLVGTHALYNESSYSFQSHSNKVGVYVLSLKTGESRLLSDGSQSGNYTWTGIGSEVLWQKQIDGATEFWIVDAAAPEKRYGKLVSEEYYFAADTGMIRAYRAGYISALIANLRVSRLTDDTFVIVASVPNDVLLTPPAYSTGQEYSALPVRSFFPGLPIRQGLRYLRFDIDRTPPQPQFRLSWEIVDILKATELEFVPHTGVLPMGPINCDVSPAGVAFVGVTREQSKFQDRVWTSDLFFIPTTQFNLKAGQKHIVPQRIAVEKFSGAASFPIVSPTGKSIAFMKNENKNKVTSKNHIFIAKIADSKDLFEVLLHADTDSKTQDAWALNPETLLWSNDETQLFVSAADAGRQRIFEVPLRTLKRLDSGKNMPTPLDVGYGSVSNVYRYSHEPSDNRLLVSKSSFVENSVFLSIDHSTKDSAVLSKLTDCEDLGLKRSQISEFWYKGSGDYRVHTWLVKPSHFQEDNKYPVAVLIHGGPLSSWQDLWSTRWNPVLFAEQGYIVICPDITGSTGYNEEYKEAAIRDFGGRPYYDLENCFDYIEQHLAFADSTNAVALGGSYGGYLIYWLAGQPLARKFKCLVAHAGIFNAPILYASDVPDIWKVLFGGYDSDPSQISQIFAKWDPVRYANMWETPILITHGELDRRCPHVMGLAAFTMAQMKGLETKFLSFPDEGHFVLKLENVLHWHTVVISWMDSYTKTTGL